MSNYTSEQLAYLNSMVLHRMDSSICEKAYEAVTSIIVKENNKISLSQYAWLFQYLCTNALTFNNHGGGKMMLLSFMMDKIPLNIALNVADNTFKTKTLTLSPKSNEPADVGTYYLDYVKECQSSGMYSESDATCMLNKISTALNNKLLKALGPCELYMFFRAVCTFFKDIKSNELAEYHLTIVKLILQEINKFVVND